ncbi:MAG: hypothetical protein IPL59_05470 [Candidatus Competibacteraceae bacterium]|nr:hypothetical protein [Candidatus Competibacteraceae bacterium]
MKVGDDVLEELYRDLLKVDAEWSIHTPTGFTWWADPHAQHIDLLGEVGGPDDEVGVLVAVRTELLRELVLDDLAASALNSRLMAFASLAGPVYDPTTRTLSLSSLMAIHEDTRRWMPRLLSIAALLQINETRRLSPELATLLQAEIAASGPPQRGQRPEPDEMAEVVPRLLAPLGCQPSRWQDAEFADTLERYLQQPPALLATGEDNGFTVEFPYGDQTSLFQAMADQPHPAYGNGLFVLQSFPVGHLSNDEGIRLALALNAVELAERPFGYGLGSYCYQRNLLHFVSFFPNLTHSPGLLPNLYFAAAQRARALSIRLMQQDWTASTVDNSGPWWVPKPKQHHCTRKPS